MKMRAAVYLKSVIPHLWGAQAVHSNKKQRMQRQHSNVPNASIYSESCSSCNSRFSESTFLLRATKFIGHGRKKQKENIMCMVQEK